MSLLKLSWTNTVSTLCDTDTQQQPTGLKYSTCRVQNVRMSIHPSHWKKKKKPLTFPILPITSNQKLWLFNLLSSPSCHPETFVTFLFLEVKSLIWDGDCATGFPCGPEFQRLLRRQLGVRGHGNPLPKGFMGKPQAWRQLCSPHPTLLTECTHACEIFVGLKKEKGVSG